MRYTFVWPSTPTPSGGVNVLYEYANALAKRGHAVSFVHGPAWPRRINRVEEITWFRFDDAVRHHIVDSIEDPSLPDGDVTFASWMPSRLGQPTTIVQGNGMTDPRLERQLLRARNPKVFVARWLQDVALEAGAPPEQLRTIVSGIDHSVFRTTKGPEDRSIDVAILYHDHPAKGWDVGLEALRLLHDERPDLRIVAFTASPPAQTVPAWVDVRVGLDHRQLAHDVYNDSKLLLQPSWYEGFGLTAVEAMACGAALVTTDNGGSAEYADDGTTALVCAPGDAAGLAKLSAALLDDPAHRAAIATRGSIGVRRFDWDRAATELDEMAHEYAADPLRFQGPPAPSEEADFSFRLGYGSFDPVYADG